MSSPVYARSSDNVLAGAVITSSTFAPVTGYDLTTLALMRPELRVVFDGETGSVTWTIGSPGSVGHILCIPMHNFTPGGSPGVLTVTNDNGLNVDIPIPEQQADGYPPTLVADLTTLAADAELVFGELTLNVSGNASNLVLGGAVALYGPKRTFADLSANSEGSFVGTLKESYESREDEATNEYGSRYVQEYDWTDRQLEWNVTGPNSGVVLARDWYLANRGHARPSLLWPYPDELTLGILSPMFGTWQKRFTLEPLTNTDAQFSAVMDEWPKGQLIP